MEIILLFIIVFMAAVGLATLVYDWAHNAPKRRRNRLYDRAIRNGWLNRA